MPLPCMRYPIDDFGRADEHFLRIATAQRARSTVRDLVDDGDSPPGSHNAVRRRSLELPVPTTTRSKSLMRAAFVLAARVLSMSARFRPRPQR